MLSLPPLRRRSGTDDVPAWKALIARLPDRHGTVRGSRLLTSFLPCRRRRAAADMYDWLIVGAGFAGSVLAERLASQRGESVLLIDRRPHIGGNAYDHYDDAGLLVHRYGPHIFHTNSIAVLEYLSKFTEWRPYQHRVQASVDGRLVPFPINLDTINQLYGTNLTSFEIEAFFTSMAEPRD